MISFETSSSWTRERGEPAPVFTGVTVSPGLTPVKEAHGTILPSVFVVWASDR